MLIVFICVWISIFHYLENISLHHWWFMFVMENSVFIFCWKPFHHITLITISNKKDIIHHIDSNTWIRFYWYCQHYVYSEIPVKLGFLFLYVHRVDLPCSNLFPVINHTGSILSGFGFSLPSKICIVKDLLLYKWVWIRTSWNSGIRRKGNG